MENRIFNNFLGKCGQPAFRTLQLLMFAGGLLWCQNFWCSTWIQQVGGTAALRQLTVGQAVPSSNSMPQLLDDKCLTTR
ncbi:Uncharacterised protein [Corynebacterium cystitidis]|uniref:Uncharacterized protein n=1 Tax=Corynebacterium cystitidis DSM 20524 TaxID=1121357 RepID=A0A1H9VTH2_9CORY|nr:hypothetical protein SAMN05661109_02376 [Corynebacterium cystitidis DSM 20524]SNV90064.1 Uncharacterised protein [Corynebacterium cystitidis]